MKRILIALALLAPVLCWAGLRAVSFEVKGVVTGNTASTHTLYNVSGQLLEYGVSVVDGDGTASTASVQAVTSANIGSSLSGAKTLITMQSVTNTLKATTSLVSTTPVWLYNDTVTVTSTNGASSNETVKVILLLNTE